MPPKRRRACESCHAAKVRCELSVPGSTSVPPCRRCRNAGKQCFLAARRLQRNRIAELEAQVEALTEGLETQQSNDISVVLPTESSGQDEPPSFQHVDLQCTQLTIAPLNEFITNAATELGQARVHLACFAANSAVATILRQFDASPWTKYHDDCISRIRESPHALPTDHLFCQLVDADRLCYQVASQSGLCHQLPPEAFGLNSPSTRSLDLKQEIDEWSMKTLKPTREPLLVFHRHIAILYLNETTLHTPTNRATFAAPFNPERITPTDFAAPVVMIDHIAALYAIKDSCHAALDIALKLDLSRDLSFSPVAYNPRVLYALFVLIKLYVAVTAPGNTFGAVLGKAELLLEEYFEKFRVRGQEVATSNPQSAESTIFTAAAWLEDWFIDYKAIAEQYEHRMSLEMMWPPSMANSATFGVELHPSDYAIRPDDLIWTGERDETNSEADTQGSKNSPWKYTGIRMESCGVDFA